jgi:ribosomal protein S12 methylthiotransferase accessory factor
MGITRLANVTGLDRVGIPVVMAVRPNSRSLAVAQGKGVSLAAARASAAMEAIESYHGEHITKPVKIASYEELRYTHEVVDPSRLPQVSTSTFHGEFTIPWVEAFELFSRAPLWIPYEVVHTNYSLPMPAGSGCFVMSSNGCASGNHLLEAISHGICEVVERDATTLFQVLEEKQQAARRVDLSTVIDPTCRQILSRLSDAQIGEIVWDTTTEIGIPAFLCSILDASSDVFETQFTSSGMGCHPTKEVALLRALTEAAQSRLTLIAGTRDDMSRSRFRMAHDRSSLERNQELLSGSGASRDFGFIATHVDSSIAGDVQWQLRQLRAAGFVHVAVVDLTRAELGVPVVRVVIPGLECSHLTVGYVPGTRARRAMGFDA